MVVVDRDLHFQTNRLLGTGDPLLLCARRQYTGVFPAVIPLHPVPYATAKRALDVVVAIGLLCMLAPMMLVVALLVRLSSRGPVIFKQTRVGEGGQMFTFYKFRSMYANAEERLDDVLRSNEVTGPVFKMKNDPRITPLGRVLRKYSLDELPQLCNVIKGDMSLVGPRPPLPAEVLKYAERERRRLSVRPGLTCLWQISGRSTVEFEQWMEMDLAYIRSMSFWNDLSIFLKTIPAVITARGAY